MSSFVCVCLSVCLSARIPPEPHTIFINFCMLPMAVARSSYGFVGISTYGFMDDIVFFYNRPNSGMNFATKDRFRLNLLSYRIIGQNSITYY